MKKSAIQKRNLRPLPLVAAVAAIVGAPSLQAIEFDFGEVSGTLDSTITVGSSWRVTSPDRDLICFSEVEGGSGFSCNSDDGNLNFKRGETYSKILRGFHELELNYKGMTFFVRGRYFYDFELKDEERLRTQISDPALSESGASIDFLDVVLSYGFEVGNVPVDLRFGKQVINWGESLFIQEGINVINPIDVATLRTPGSEIREGLLPQRMLYGQAALTDTLTLEGFVQFSFEKFIIDPQGTFFAGNDFVGNGSTQLFVGQGLINEHFDQSLGLPAQAIGPDGRFLADIIPGVPGFRAGDLTPQNANTVPRFKDDNPDSDDYQFGISLKYFAEALNSTEFGFYYLNYHSRRPLINGIRTTTPGSFDAPANGGFFVSYPEDIRLYGLSFNTSTLGGLSIAGDITYRPNAPLQVDDVELLTGALFAPVSQLNADLQTVAPGQAFNGYVRKPVVQGQATLIQVFDQVLGADQVRAILETGFTRVNGLPDRDDLRFEGPGAHLRGFTELPDGSLVCEVGPPVGPGGAPLCEDEGFATAFSWGYRLVLQADFNNLFFGSNLTPTIAFNHDVNGTTPLPIGNFIEDSKAITFSLTTEYQRALRLNLTYTNFYGAGKNNLINDRDFVSVNASYAF